MANLKEGHEDGARELRSAGKKFKAALALAFVLGVSVGVVIVLKFVRAHVICYGPECLHSERNSDAVGSFTFAGEHCFITAERLSSRQFQHAAYSGLASEIMEIRYFLYPELLVFIIRDGERIVAVPADMVKPKKDLDFCARDFVVDLTQDALTFNGR